MSGKKQSIFDEESFVLDDNTLAQSVDSSADKATATSDFLFLIDCTNTMDWVLDTLVNTILEVADIFNEDALRMR